MARRLFSERDNVTIFSFLTKKLHYCASLRPSLKSALSGAFLYSPPLGVTFAPTILQSPWLTGGPTKGEADEVQLCVWSLTHPTHPSSNIFPALSCLLYQLCFKRRIDTFPINKI